MSDDDRTVDADDAALDELRRLAADVRGRHVPAPPADPDAADTHDAGVVDGRADRDDDDVTVGADDASLDELRRFAAEARAQQSARRSDASTGVSPGDALGSSPPAAPSSPSSVGPPPLPEIRVPEALLASTTRSPSVADAPGTTVLADLPVPDPLDRRAGPDPDHDHDRVHDRDDVTRPRVGDGWRPPPRTVLPTEPERRHEVEHGPWRRIALGLAAALVVVIAAFVVWIFVIDGGGTDEPAPTEPTAPTLDGEPEPTDVGGGSGGN